MSEKMKEMLDIFDVVGEAKRQGAEGVIDRIEAAARKYYEDREYLDIKPEFIFDILDEERERLK